MSRNRASRLANAVLLLPVGYGAALVFLASWRICRGHADAPTAAVLGLVGAVLGAAFLAVRRLPAPARARLALLVASSGVSLFCLEGVSAYLEPPEDVIHGRVEGCRATGKEYDRRPHWEVVRALRGQGKHAVLSIHPSYFYPQHSELRLGDAVLIPLGGVANRTTVVCNETGDYLIYDSDEHGFHNPAGLYRRFPRGVIHPQ
jgi:hypothetical protein